MTAKNWLGDFKPRKGNTRSHPARTEMVVGSVVLSTGQRGVPGPRLGALEASLKALEARVAALEKRLAK